MVVDRQAQMFSLSKYMKESIDHAYTIVSGKSDRFPSEAYLCAQVTLILFKTEKFNKDLFEDAFLEHIYADTT
jgi:hypothetical protein